MLSLEEQGEVAVESVVPASNCEESWVTPVQSGNAELPGEEALIMVDSGSYAHVCPPSWAAQYPLQRPSVKGCPMALTADDGRFRHSAIDESRCS